MIDVNIKGLLYGGRRRVASNAKAEEWPHPSTSLPFSGIKVFAPRAGLFTLAPTKSAVRAIGLKGSGIEAALQKYSAARMISPGGR